MHCTFQPVSKFASDRPWREVMVTFYHKVKLVQDIFVIPASYSHKPKTNGTHCMYMIPPLICDYGDKILTSEFAVAPSSYMGYDNISYLIFCRWFSFK